MLITISRAITCKTSLLPTMPSTITKRSDYEHIRLCEEKQPFTDVPQKGCSYKFRRKTPVLESLNKVADHQHETLLKRDLSTKVILLILQNFYEKLFHRSSSDDCSCMMQNYQRSENLSHVAIVLLIPYCNEKACYLLNLKSLTVNS